MANLQTLEKIKRLIEKHLDTFPEYPERFLLVDAVKDLDYLISLV